MVEPHASVHMDGGTAAAGPEIWKMQSPNTSATGKLRWMDGWRKTSRVVAIEVD